MRNRYLLGLSLIFLMGCAKGFQANPDGLDLGSNDPSGGGNPPTQPPENPDTESFNIFTDVGYTVGDKVDQYYQEHRELLVQRGVTGAHSIDSCDPQLRNQTRFAERISYAVVQNMTARKAKLAFIGNLFDIPTDQEKFVPNSLMSHAMCEVTSSTLTKTIGSDRVPSAAVIKKANELVKRFNGLRQKVIDKAPKATMEMAKFWGRVMMCLSYTESLTTADTSSSDSVAQKYAPSGYRRPAGVLFYEDPNQPASSRLNLGLFQFTPSAGGNINPCIKQWNEIYPSCQVSTSATQADMIKVLGSSYQTFNAFCGANKPAQMFSVQVNTTDVNNTHPLNRKSNGSLKASEDRCVSLHFLPGNSYNHFGPFQNSTGSNLDELLSCSLAD